ncbi:leucine-rich repeat domain, L domain-like protein [Artemisia annua]|uniref:Leucine-rich repeat domain, L domain-like protein n=1 Tax=Artemisia annua TaxID=35608 RepID=A0A2U1LN35_ARTAN|nr:leucine-rich repeat domain, L domain-like protein [Artemisia annua]
MKILKLSHCYQLRSLGGFHELPLLEMLLLKNCMNFTNACESIQNCDELIHIDLTYCKTFRKFIGTLANLKKVKKLILYGCSLGECSPNIRAMDSLRIHNAAKNGIPIRNETIYISIFDLPQLIISNITKNLTLLYKHYVRTVNVDGHSLTFINHRMYGKNEMEDGDQLTISIRECGVSLVYDDDDGKNEKKGDLLSYYKSWNHIIGGDLSAFQLTTTEHFLDTRNYLHKKSNKHGQALEGYTSSMAKDLLVETDKYSAQPCVDDILCETCEKKLVSRTAKPQQSASNGNLGYTLLLKQTLFCRLAT